MYVIFFLPSECPVEKVFGIGTFTASKVLLMAEILHHLECMKPQKQWDKLPLPQLVLAGFQPSTVWSEPSPTGERVEAPDTAYRGALPENPDARHRCEGVHVSVSPQKGRCLFLHMVKAFDTKVKDTVLYCTIVYIYIILHIIYSVYIYICNYICIYYVYI